MTDKPMTVGEIVKKLQSFSQSSPIMRFADGTYYASVCSIEEISYEKWLNDNGYEDMDAICEMENQGLEREDFPFVNILFYGGY